MSGDPLDPLEAACGAPLRVNPAAGLGSAPHADPVEALQLAMEPALRSGRCYVAFSGGRDSSVVLAVAFAAARRADLPDPIPVTLRFPRAPATREDAWQERVVAHVGARAWERVAVGDELDLLGPVARDALARVGPYWPANAHLALQLMRTVGPGAWLLSGEGGDELFAWWRWAAAARILGRRQRLTARGAPGLALALAPRPVKRAVASRREPELPWLTPAARRAHRRRAARFADAPVRWDRYLAWMRALGEMDLSLGVQARLGSEVGVHTQAPLLDRGFLAALRDAGGAHGLGSRTQALTSLFGDLLFPEVLARRQKATFDEAFWGPEARSFAVAWDGATGIDPALVDAERLRSAWLGPEPDSRSACLLHRAYVISHTPAS